MTSCSQLIWLTHMFIKHMLRKHRIEHQKFFINQKSFIFLLIYLLKYLLTYIFLIENWKSDFRNYLLWVSGALYTSRDFLLFSCQSNVLPAEMVDIFHWKAKISSLILIFFFFSKGHLVILIIYLPKYKSLTCLKHMWKWETSYFFKGLNSFSQSVFRLLP